MGETKCRFSIFDEYLLNKPIAKWENEGLLSGKLANITMENHIFLWGHQCKSTISIYIYIYIWPCSIANSKSFPEGTLR